MIGLLRCACTLTYPPRRLNASFQRYVPRSGIQGGFPLTPRRDLPSLHPGNTSRTSTPPPTPLRSAARAQTQESPPRVSRRHAPFALSPFCLRPLLQQVSCSLCSVYAALRHCAQVRERLAYVAFFGLWGSRDGDDDGIPLNPQKYLTNRGKATLGSWAAHLRIAFGGPAARFKPKCRPI